MRELRHLSIAKNVNGQLVASRAGRLICSPRDPQREAQAWLEKQNLSSEDRHVLVLGAGIGHHVSAIQSEYSGLRIDVLEYDEETRDYIEETYSANQNIKILSKLDIDKSYHYDAILSFRPAWVGYENEYLESYLVMTQRDALSEVSFKLKGATYCENEKHTEEAKLWQVLRELIN